MSVQTWFRHLKKPQQVLQALMLKTRAAAWRYVPTIQGDSTLVQGFDPLLFHHGHVVGIILLIYINMFDLVVLYLMVFESQKVA